MTVGPLYTYLDVQFLLEQFRDKDGSPSWLVAASTYADGLLVRVISGTTPDTIDGFLRNIFGQRYDRQNGLLLDGAPSEVRLFPVDIEEAREGDTSNVPNLH